MPDITSDFASLANAYDFLGRFFTDKQAELWHCNGHYMQLADYRDWLKDQNAACKVLFYLTCDGYKASEPNVKGGECQSIFDL